MSEKFNGNSGWVEVGGDVEPPDEGVFPYSDEVKAEINGANIKKDPEYEVHQRGAIASLNPKKPFELPGKDGRSNTPPLPTPKQAQEGMTEEEIEEQANKNKNGANEARKALGLPPKPKKSDEETGKDDEPPRLF